jgi:hypothetical protein
VLETEALIFDDRPLKAEALDAAAHFKQNLSDWKDIFREPLHRLIDSGTKESVELRMRR